MSTTFPRQTTTLRSVMEKAAGMHTAPAAGTTVLLFGACAVADGHDRCPEHNTVGATTYICRCTCHAGIDPADFDAAYGTAWWAETSEAE